MLNCGCTAVKYVLWIVNFLIFIAGLAVLALGIWIYSDLSSFLYTVRNLPVENYQLEVWTQSQVLKEAMYVLMALGGFLLILGFLGCCGASRENRCFLLMYGIVVLLLSLTLASLIGVFFGMKDKLVTEGRTAMDKALLEDYRYNQKTNDTNIATNVLNLLMAKLGCCGVNDYTDFKRKVKDWPSELEIPPACCKLKDSKDNSYDPVDSNCLRDPRDSNANINQGCFDKLITIVNDNLLIVLGAMVGLIVVLFVAAVFSFALFRALERGKCRGSSRRRCGPCQDSFRCHSTCHIPLRPSNCNYRSSSGSLKRESSYRSDAMIVVNLGPRSSSKRSFM